MNLRTDANITKSLHELCSFVTVADPVLHLLLPKYSMSVAMCDLVVTH